MFVVTSNACSHVREVSERHSIALAAALLGALLCSGPAPAADSRPAGLSLYVPSTDSRPVIDGKLDEPFWKDTARTGPLKVTASQPGTSTTEALILHDAGQLYVALRCTGKLAEAADEKASAPPNSQEFADLLINSNADRNSCYLIRITPDGGGKIACSYNEHTPPWRDRTWQPQFEFAVAQDAAAWTAEFALPFDIFCKNKTLASEIGFNVRRFRIPGQETHCWQGTFDDPGDWGILTGIPARDSLPAPDYVVPKPAPFSSAEQWNVTTYRPPPITRRKFLAEQQRQTISLGPGSAHPGATGAVRLELEEFLLAGDPHASGDHLGSRRG